LSLVLIACIHEQVILIKTLFYKQAQ
jgi:hypothetical protein